MIVDKNGSEIPNGSWFVFIRKAAPTKVHGNATVLIRQMVNNFVDNNSYYTDTPQLAPKATYRNKYFSQNFKHVVESGDQNISTLVLNIYDTLLIPDNVRDLGFKAVVSYLHLGGLEVPNGINQLINEDNPDEEQHHSLPPHS